MLARKVKKHLREAAGTGEFSVPDDVMERYLADCRKALEDIYAKHHSHFPRVSDLGRPALYLWCRKNYPELSPTFEPKMHMTFWAGKVWEAVFLAVAETAGLVKPDGFQKRVRLKFPTLPEEIPGSMDLKYEGNVWDIKTCHNDAYTEKWKSAETLMEHDAFCYTEQGWAYSTGEGTDFGGWIVINKNNGDFKDVPLKNPDDIRCPQMIDNAITNMELAYGEQPELPEDEPELYKGVPTGNRKIPSYWARTPYAKKLWPNAVHAKRGQQDIYYTHFEGIKINGIKVVEDATS